MTVKDSYSYVAIYFICFCNQLWENSPLMHKDKYLEIRNSIIQSVISRGGLKLQACNFPQAHRYPI